MEERIERLFTLLKKGVTPFHVVEEAKKQLEEAGFEDDFVKFYNTHIDCVYSCEKCNVSGRL